VAAPMLSRTLPRLVAAAGFALLCYAAFDTIHRASVRVRSLLRR